MTADLAAVLDRWQPDCLAHAASRTRAAQAQVEGVRGELGGTVAGALLSLAAWSGTAAGRCQRSLDERSAVLTTVAVRLAELSELLEQAALQLAERVERVRSAQVRLDASRSELAGVAALVAPVVLASSTAARADALQVELSELVVTDRRLRGELEASGRAARALRREHDAELVRAEQGGLGDREGRGDPTAVPPAGTGAEATADWWSALTAAERGRLVRGQRGAAVGALVGIPSAARDEANRLALGRRLSGYDGSSATPAQRAAHTLDLLVAAELDRLQSVARGVPVLLLSDEPTRWSGRGRVVVAVGDPDLADNVAYVVPGLDDQVRTSLRIDDDRATALVRAAGATTAAVAWLGYQTPQLRTVASSDLAERGARLLADDLSGLLASRGSRDPHLTVVGHSYGSTTAALGAARLPGAVDDLVLVGSPGAEATAASDLPVRPGHVWVGASDEDLVTRLAWFGPDPASAAFGARRFPAEVTRPGAGVFDAHGHYLDDAGQALAHIGAIAAGAGAVVPLVPGR